MINLENKNLKKEEQTNMPYQNKTVRCFGAGVKVGSNSRLTHLNNNDLVIGVSGGGKTGSYVIPYIMNSDESFIVADTKSNLYRMCKDDLVRRGYKVYNIDLINPANGAGYDPLRFVGKIKKNGVWRYNDKDILSITNTLIPNLDTQEPFWSEQARQFASCLISYVLENAAEKDKNLATVLDVFNYATATLTSDRRIPLLEEICVNRPESLAARRYSMIKSSFNADKTWSSVIMFVETPLSVFEFDEAREMVTKPSTFRFENMGFEKTAVFLNISDSDRSLDGIVNVFYTQAFQTLLKTADKQPDSRLQIPVRIVLDDFATNCKIEDFDKIISVIRSRDISTSIILQSISQLDAGYGAPKRMTIVNNCDNILYLGGTDFDTVDFIAQRANISPIEVMGLGLDKAFFIQRGMPYAKKVDKLPPYSIIPKRSSRRQGTIEAQTEV